MKKVIYSKGVQQEMPNDGLNHCLRILKFCVGWFFATQSLVIEESQPGVLVVKLEAKVFNENSFLKNWGDRDYFSWFIQ